MLRKYNIGLTGDLLLIFINYCFLHTKPTPLWSKVFSQSLVSQLLGEKFALHCFSHLFQSIPSSFWRTKAKIDHPGLKVSPDSDAWLLYWHAYVALRYNLHTQITLQGTAEHCWDTLQPGKDKPMCEPHTEEPFPIGSVCSQVLTQPCCSCSSNPTQCTCVLTTAPGVSITKSSRSSHPLLAWNAWEKITPCNYMPGKHLKQEQTGWARQDCALLREEAEQHKPWIYNQMQKSTYAYISI